MDEIFYDLTLMKRYPLFYMSHYEYLRDLDTVINKLPQYSVLKDDLKDFELAINSYDNSSSAYNKMANSILGDDRDISLNLLYCLFFLISISLSVVRIIVSKST